MNPKKIFIALIKNLVILVIATLIFSSITLDFPSFLKGFFGDVFEYASPEAQKQVVSRLAESCSGFEKGSAISLAQICTNKSLLDSMKQDCVTYHELQGKNIKVENEAKFREDCNKIESGEIDEMCVKYNQNQIMPDFSKIKLLCREYKDGKINNNEFFYGIVASPFEGQQIGNPKFGFLEKYNRLVSYLNSNKILYVVIITILLAFLYLLIGNTGLLLIALGEISFSIGMLIMLPYIGILIYDKSIGIDTTSILGSILGLGGIFDFKSILSVIFLLFLRTYNNLIIAAGIIFLAIGIIGKIYARKLNKNKSEEKGLEQELGKKSEAKEKSMKKVLDELEEVQKKKKGP